MKSEPPNQSADKSKKVINKIELLGQGLFG
jgi:hypothetical protein